jgi:hypothetical protein
MGWFVVIPTKAQFRTNQTLSWHTANMRTNQDGVEQVEQLNDRALLDLVERGLAALASRPLDGTVDGNELAESVERLHRLETMTAAEKLRRIAEVDLRQTWRAEGARSTADLLAQRLQLTQREAHAQTQTAVGLEQLPQTAAAVRSGQIGLGQAEVAARAAADAHPGVREQLDDLVAAEGKALDRRQLREQVHAWAATHDPDLLAQRERRAWANRRLSVTADTCDGSVQGAFQLDPVGGATLIAALDALARKTGVDDERSYAQRLADGLVELAQRSLDAGELPQMAVQRSHVIMITHPDGQARLDGIGPVSQTCAELVCCDAEITEVTVARNGAVLDAGRTRRQPTRRQRIAVIARDQTCVGCGAPAGRCQIHHMRWWIRDLGPTDEDNLCLTCWSCHHKIHEGGWLVVRDPGSGRFGMHPPDLSGGRSGRVGQRRAS